MKNLLGFATAVIGVLALASVTHAQDTVYSVQFGNSVAFDSGNAGPDPEPASSFNSDTGTVTYFSPETTGIDDLFDQNGNPSTIDETKYDDGGYHQGGPVSGFASAADNDFFNGSHCFGGNGYNGDTSPVLTLTGLSATSTYNLYLIFQDPNGGGGTQVEGTAGGLSLYGTTISTASMNSYVAGTGLTAGTANPANYFEFTGLTGSSTITAKLESGNIEFIGFQLDQLATVPEPSTLCLMVLGGLCLVGFGRRKSVA